MLCLLSLPFSFRSALKALLSVIPETRRTRDLLQGCAVHSQANPIVTETKHQRDRNRLVEISENPAGRALKYGSPDLAYGCSRGGPRMSVSTRDSSSVAPPQPPPTARAGPAARTPQQASARALPSSARPAPGTGLESRVQLSGRQLGVQSCGCNAQLAGALAGPRTCLLWGLQEPLGALLTSLAPADNTDRGLGCICGYSLCPGQRDARPVTCVQVLRQPGQRGSHGSR